MSVRHNSTASSQTPKQGATPDFSRPCGRLQQVLEVARIRRQEFEQLSFSERPLAVEPVNGPTYTPSGWPGIEWLVHKAEDLKHRGIPVNNSSLLSLWKQELRKQVGRWKTTGEDSGVKRLLSPHALQVWENKARPRLLEILGKTEESQPSSSGSPSTGFSHPYTKSYKTFNSELGKNRTVAEYTATVEGCTIRGRSKNDLYNKIWKRLIAIETSKSSVRAAASERSKCNTTDPLNADPLTLSEESELRECGYLGRNLNTFNTPSTHRLKFWQCLVKRILNAHGNRLPSNFQDVVFGMTRPPLNWQQMILTTTADSTDPCVVDRMSFMNRSREESSSKEVDNDESSSEESNSYESSSEEDSS